MAFALEPSSKLKRQVRAAARERLDLAVAELAALGEGTDDPERAVHEMRKRCKEVRALARLARPTIGAEFDRFDRQVRDAAQALSSIRDAHAVLATLDELIAARGPHVDDSLALVRDRHAHSAELATSSVEPGAEPVDHATDLLLAARRGVRRWDVENDADWLEEGLRTTYHRCRRQLRRARGGKRDEEFHAWRKAVKTLWYQMRLLESAAPSVLRPLIDRLDDLADVLGDDHDLAVLVALLESDPDHYGGPEPVATVIGHARGRQVELRARSLRIGATTFAESTDAFVARILAYWQATSRHGPEPLTGGVAELVADERREARDPAPDAPEHRAERNVERERKFIVDDLPELPDGGIGLRQGYLAIDGTVTVRVRDTGSDERTLTVKAGRGAVRTELEFPISGEQFEVAWGRTRRRRLRKTRHRVDLSGWQPDGTSTVADIDVFHDELDGLVIAEIEFDSDEAMSHFMPPAWLGREVTDDPAFTNASLAVRGLPPLQ